MTEVGRKEQALQVTPEPDRWTLMRDVAVFQGKLLLDGLRDLLLSPISIVLALLDLFLGDRTSGRRFYNLLYLGWQSDRWINLFGDAHRVPPPKRTPFSDRSIDDLINDLEYRVHKDYEAGGLSANAKETIDKALDSIQSKLHRPFRGG